MSLGNIQGPSWNLLSPDIVKCVLRKLPIRDSWACRGLSKCWASTVSSTVEFECVTQVQPDQLRSKLGVLQRTSRQRCAHQGRNTITSHTLQLTETLSVTRCAELLESLSKQRASLPICTIKIPLLPPEGKDVTTPGITQGIAKIADALSSLEDKGVSALICLKADGNGRVASADVTKCVAPVIHEVDCAPGFDMTSSSLHPQEWKIYSRNHLKALWFARLHLQGLCMSEATTPQLIRASMCLVAGFTNLKKLVLQMALESPDLSPLTQLTCLEEISVVVAGLGNCTELIRHHKHALTHISLSAETWEKSTLRAVSEVIPLQKLVINIQYLSFRSAAIIASMKRPHSIHVVLRLGAGLHALRVLSSPDCKVTDLTVRAFTPAMLQQVGTMHLLASVTLVQCNLQGIVLRCQLNVTHLTLVDCSQADDSFISLSVLCLLWESLLLTPKEHQVSFSRHFLCKIWSPFRKLVIY